MENQPLEIKTVIQILKPIHEVFEAIVDPLKMSVYFLQKSSGRMEEGKQLIWKFPEFAEEFPIKVKKVEADKYIAFSWTLDEIELLVEITLTSIKKDTLVTVTEKNRNNDESGISWLKGNTEGWANFLACLKAYLEYGINLRKGAFDYMKDAID